VLLDSQDSYASKLESFANDGSGVESRSRKFGKEKTKKSDLGAKEKLRQCERMKDQEDVDRTKLAMRSPANKNEILGTGNSRLTYCS
jgi:hypothetical protein